MHFSTLVPVVVLVSLIQHVESQTVCSNEISCNGGTFLTCVEGTCCNTAKSADCLKCDSYMDCQTCNVSHYLDNKMMCIGCPTGKNSPAGSNKLDDCTAPVDPKPKQIRSNISTSIASVSDVFPMDTTADTSTDKIFYSFFGIACLFPLAVIILGVFLMSNNLSENSNADRGTIPMLYCMCCGPLLIVATPVLLIYILAHWYQGCQPGAVPGGNTCIVCPPGTFDSANWTNTTCIDSTNHNSSDNDIFARDILFAGNENQQQMQQRLNTPVLCSKDTNNRVCRQCPTGRFNSQTFAASNDAVCLPCTSPDCSIELCTWNSEGGGNSEGCRCISKEIAKTKPLEDFNGQISKLFDYTYVTGGEVCTKETGFVCNDNGQCSKFTCDGGDCCFIAFEAEKNAAGCSQSKANYCTEISKALFISNPVKRTDVVVDCGNDCQTMVYAKEGIESLYYINMSDMIIEIVAALFLTYSAFVNNKENSNGLYIKFVALCCLGPIDIILQVWVLILAIGTSPAFESLQDAKCLDVTSENGRMYEKTLIELANSITSTAVFGSLELVIILGEIALEIYVYMKQQKLSVEIYVGVGLQIVGTIIAIVDFAVFSTRARQSTQSVFSSTVESGSWCVSLANETQTCTGIGKLQELGKGYIPSTESIEYLEATNIVLYCAVALIVIWSVCPCTVFAILNR